MFDRQLHRYISNPYLVNDTKFDLRVYVHVVSYDPLRIYVCRDGLVRFATQKYSNKKGTVKNRYMHLTNYSINKKSDEFEQNDDAAECQGHKWGMKALWKYLETERGVDTGQVWTDMCDVVIKTILSADGTINSGVKMNVNQRSCVHEVFGFDIMLDATLKPWLIEVNISPSLHSASGMDHTIKGRMMRDVFNIAGFHLPPPEIVAQLGGTSRSDIQKESRLKARRPGVSLSPSDRAKHAYFLNHPAEAAHIVDELSDDDLMMLIETESEFMRRGEMQRIFPSEDSEKYLHYTSTPRYYNMLLEQWGQKWRGAPVGAAIKYLKQLVNRPKVKERPKTAQRRYSDSTAGPKFPQRKKSNPLSQTSPARRSSNGFTARNTAEKNKTAATSMDVPSSCMHLRPEHAPPQSAAAMASKAAAQAAFARVIGDQSGTSGVGITSSMREPQQIAARVAAIDLWAARVARDALPVEQRSAPCDNLQENFLGDGGATVTSNAEEEDLDLTITVGITPDDSKRIRSGTAELLAEASNQLEKMQAPEAWDSDCSAATTPKGSPRLSRARDFRKISLHSLSSGSGRSLSSGSELCSGTNTSASSRASSARLSTSKSSSTSGEGLITRRSVQCDLSVDSLNAALRSEPASLTVTYGGSSANAFRSAGLGRPRSSSSGVGVNPPSAKQMDAGLITGKAMGSPGKIAPFHPPHFGAAATQYAPGTRSQYAPGTGSPSRTGFRGASQSMQFRHRILPALSASPALESGSFRAARQQPMFLKADSKHLA